MDTNANESRLKELLAAADLRPIVDGEAVEATGSEVARKSPVDGRALPSFRSAPDSLVDRAVASAETAYHDGRWSTRPVQERKEALFRLAGLLERDATDLAVLDAAGMGKPVRDVLDGDVPKAAACLRWFGEALDKHYDQALPPHPGAIGTITREPLGVVAAIAAWNYPAENLAWKIAPALAAGNSLVLKPAEAATPSACRIARLALEAGVPPGVLNVLPGAGSETGAALARHPRVQGIFFTGSSATGASVLANAGQSGVKRVALECGGKSAFLVLAGCRDLAAAARTLAREIFLNQGQTCSAPSRLIVEKSVHARFLELVLREAAAFVPANPLAPTTRLGALVSEEQLAKVERYVESGTREGARLVLGGTRAAPVRGGAYFVPTVFDGVNARMTIAREEIFGPVLSVIPVADAPEAVRVANDSPYGLAAAVWTDDIDVALGASRTLRAGTVHVNSYGEDDLSAPFGGFGQSGNGFKEKSLLALDAYSQRKTTWIKLR